MSISTSSGNIDDSTQRNAQTLLQASRPAVERIAAGVHQAVDKIADGTLRATQSLGEKSEQFNDTQQRILDNCRVYVRAKPVAAIGFALLTGFVLSRLFGPRLK